jgi:hypothetical protein
MLVSLRPKLCLEHWFPTFFAYIPPNTKIDACIPNEGF